MSTKPSVLQSKTLTVMLRSNTDNKAEARILRCLIQPQFYLDWQHDRRTTINYKGPDFDQVRVNQKSVIVNRKKGRR